MDRFPLVPYKVLTETWRSLKLSLFMSFLLVQTMALKKFCAVTMSCKETGYEGQGKRGKSVGESGERPQRSEHQRQWISACSCSSV